MYLASVRNQLLSSRSPCTLTQTDKSGLGLCAIDSIVEDQSIFKEIPLICGQYSWGIVYGYESCHHCLKSLETPLTMMRRLTTDQSIELPIPDPEMTNKLTQVYCCQGCGISFCTEDCLMTSLKLYHSAVCTNGDVEHPLVKLDEMWRTMHYPPETTSLVMVVKVIGLIITSGSIPPILKYFYQAVEHKGNAHRIFKPEFISKLHTLRDGLLQIFGNNEMVQQFLSRDSFAIFIALIGMNGQGIGSSSFADYCRRIENLPLQEAERSFLEKRLDDVYEKIEEEVGIFTDVEGTGLYELQSKLNHSCQPNVQIVFESSNYELSVKALRNIEKGEELCVSYLSSCQLESSRHSRRKFLLENYLFECKCTKCEAQINDPDLTSDEEDEEEENML